MKPVSVFIEEFPDDDAPWRIDGLGRLHGTGSSRSEPLIDVYISELEFKYLDPLKNESLAQRSRRVPLKVGLIPLLKLGSVWKNKMRCLPRRAPKSLNVCISPEQVELKTWASTAEFEGRNISLIGKGQFFIPTQNWRDLAESWVIFIRRPLPDVPYLIIPSSVIFQKCFTHSTEGVRRLLSGDLHRIIDKPSFVDAGDGVRTFFVELAKEFPTAHAYAYANLAADPIGRREYERMHRTLVAASVNEDRTRSGRSKAFLSMGLPFSNPVSMSLNGKFMPYKADRFDTEVEFAFLATEITSLNVRLAFDRLIVHRKNSGDKGLNSGDPDLKDAWPHTPATSLNLDDDEVIPVGSDTEPISELEKLLAEEAGGFNPLHLEVIKDPKLTQEYRNSMTLRGGGAEFDESATTGDSKSGDQGPAELDVQTNEAPQVPVTLDSFIETLQILRGAGHPFETRVVTSMHRFTDGGDVVNFFPRHIKNSRSWHLVSDDPLAPPRGYIVATLQSGGTWHHLIEIQRKEEKGRSLAYVRTSDGTLIEARQMRLFMLDVAYERGWNASSLRPHWTLCTINHSQKRGLHHFARAIARAIGLTEQTS
jgi:hypothetical protein